MRYKVLRPKNPHYKEGNTLLMSLRRSRHSIGGLYIDGHVRYGSIGTPRHYESFIAIRPDALSPSQIPKLRRIFLYHHINTFNFKGFEDHTDMLDIE